MFMKQHKAFILLLIGILLAVISFLWNPFGLSAQGKVTFAIAVLMITWWVSEALPMPAVALVPLVLYPLFGISSFEETARSYANPAIFLFMGGFLIGLAIEKWNLHKRIALLIVSKTGSSGNRIILGFILATGFLSMWLSNTATAMMMLPIALSVVAVMKAHPHPDGNFNHFALVLMLSIAYASNMGGIATIIGTPPNVAFVSYLEKKYQYTIDFVDWIMLCAPLSLLLLFSIYFSLAHVFFPNRIASNVSANLFIQEELKSLGSLSSNERRVLFVFLLTAGLWITKDILNTVLSIKLDDAMIAVFGGLLLFMIPATSNNDQPAGNLLEWSDTSKLAWGILLLFGGGIALAASLEKTGIMTSIGEWLASFQYIKGWILVLLIVVISIFLSEVMSNVAQVIVFAPVVSALADALQMDPLLLGVPMTLAASSASMLPMGTPPNAIVFSSGYIKLKDMLKAGFIVNLISIVLITLFCWFILPMVMKVM